MPQVDLVSACAGGGNDRKVVCETLAGDDSPENESIPDEEDTDFPPESFWLSKDAEYDWFDRNAFFERKDSTKGNANSANSNHSSQRFSVTLKSKASIIGLPKTQKSTFVDAHRRTCRSVNVRLFPKRSSSVGKSTVTITDPGSPKVSCMGRVRSKRGHRRSSSIKRTGKPLEKSKSRREKPVEKPKTTGTEKKKQKKKKGGGFYSKLMSVFRSKKADKNPDRSSSRKIVEVKDKKPAPIEPQRRSVSHVAATEPPSLGGVSRFTSGRRSGSWASEDFNQTVSESLELDRHACGMSRS